jgi:hypothetical protein
MYNKRVNFKRGKTMNKRFLFFAIFIAITLSTVFTQETNYVRLNRNPNWERTSDGRLIHIINNPVRFNAEEFIGALHEYSIRYGQFNKAKNTLEALVNAYIAFNPNYRNQSTGEVFVWTGKSRGVPSLRDFEMEPLYDMLLDDDYLYIDDYIYVILDQLEEYVNSLEFINDGLYDDGATYIVYRADEEIKITVSTDADGSRYIIGNVNSSEVMQGLMEVFSNTFSEPIPYLEGGFVAEFHDTENLYILDNMPDYLGTFTILGSQLFVEEVKTESKTIIQKQFCTPEFFEFCNAELGPGWGFIASWAKE